MMNALGSYSHRITLVRHPRKSLTNMQEITLNHFNFQIF